MEGQWEGYIRWGRLEWLTLDPILFVCIWNHPLALPLRTSEVPEAETYRGKTGGRPPKFEVGDGPCIRPPNILRNSVFGCSRKYTTRKKVSQREFFYEIEVFLARKG